jgi:hypothetical protein
VQVEKGSADKPRSLASTPVGHVPAAVAELVTNDDTWIDESIDALQELRDHVHLTRDVNDYEDEG